MKQVSGFEYLAWRQPPQKPDYYYWSSQPQESVRGSVYGYLGPCFLRGARTATIANELLDELLKGYKRPEELLGGAGLMKELKIRLIVPISRLRTIADA